MNLEETIRKHVLKNAFDYGKASASNVAGKVIAENPEAKKDLKETMRLIQKEIKRVSTLSKQEIEKELETHSFEEKKVVEKKLKLDDCIEGKVVTRFLPEPNGYLHLGHAKAFFLNNQLAKDWNGRILLRFDDTNPEAESQEFVEAIREGLEWLGAEFQGESFASDSMPELYAYAGKLIEKESAFICNCSKETMSEKRRKQETCACRKKTKQENQAEWKKMVEGELEEGEATLRLKGDLTSLNTVMRDPVLFRIIKKKHYRQGEKYSCWPTYDFEACILDSLTGVTHALRSKEYELRDELYYKILEELGLRKPVLYDFSRLNLKGTVLSKRLIKPLIEEKKVWGWDDPRLPTLFGLRRRGIQPEAIRKFVLSFGLSKVESEPDWEALLVENRRLLEGEAEHYFAVENPVRVTIKNTPASSGLRLKKHPLLDKGTRFIKVKSEVFIAKKDFDELKEGSEFRLKDYLNCIIQEKKKDSALLKYSGKEANPGIKKIQWVSTEGAISCELIELNNLFENNEFNTRSLTSRKAFCEKECVNLQENAVIQFERIGFCKLDDKNKMRFIII
ncbi:MAG: glutamate--tRNA ligase [Candidatus Micrarchaeota archaeon]